MEAGLHCELKHMKKEALTHTNLLEEINMKITNHRADIKIFELSEKL